MADSDQTGRVLFVLVVALVAVTAWFQNVWGRVVELVARLPSTLSSPALPSDFGSLAILAVLFLGSVALVRTVLRP
jgi:hypothetical protein